MLPIHVRNKDLVLKRTVGMLGGIRVTRKDHAFAIGGEFGVIVPVKPFGDHRRLPAMFRIDDE